MKSIKRSASSLVLVVVIMASIVVVVFGASRLTLVQYNQANHDEDNIFALYAAKAAVEDGLARFRYNRDAETTEDKVHRFDLTGGVNAGEVSKTDAISAVANYTPASQYYDLEMKFRDRQIGSFEPATAGSNPVLGRDDLIELTGFPTEWPTPYYLRYRLEFSDCTGPVNSQVVQIQQVSQTIDPLIPVTYDQVVVAKPGTGSVVDSKDTSGNIFLRSNPGQGQSLASSIRIRSLGCSVKYAFSTSISTNGTGEGGNAGPDFDNFQTVVTATGYYGQVKRTLVAQIDRVSGRLINVYDFNVFSGTGNVSP